MRRVQQKGKEAGFRVRKGMSLVIEDHVQLLADPNEGPTHTWGAHGGPLGSRRRTGVGTAGTVGIKKTYVGGHRGPL